MGKRLKLTHAQVIEKAGFDVLPFVKRMKGQLNMDGPVRLEFDRKGIQASAEHDGNTCVIVLPTKKNIVKKLGLDDATAVLKQKASLFEEAAHCTCHETRHDDCVVHKTIRGIRKNLTREEQKNPYIKLKIAGLRSAQKQGK